MAASYLMSIHIPLLQSDPPVLAVLRREDERRLLAVKIGPVRGRRFHEDVMAYVATIATQIAGIDRTAHIEAHLLFSGQAYGAADVDQLLGGRWPAESYSVATVTPGAGEAGLKPRGRTPAPVNRFVVPRAAIISTLNLAYAQPGCLVVAMAREEAEGLARQMAVFAERANRVSTSDPDAVMEHEGEGQVIALGVGVWHAFAANAALLQWGLERVDG